MDGSTRPDQIELCWYLPSTNRSDECATMRDFDVYYYCVSLADANVDVTWTMGTRATVNNVLISSTSPMRCVVTIDDTAVAPGDTVYFAVIGRDIHNRMGTFSNACSCRC